MALPRVADLMAGAWQEHARFPGIYMKGLLTSADNPLASVNVVQVPPGGRIGRHRHAQQIETVWIIKGEAILTLEETDVPLQDGQIIAIPIDLEHALRNAGQVTVELLTFLPPLCREKKEVHTVTGRQVTRDNLVASNFTSWIQPILATDTNPLHAGDHFCTLK